MLSRERLVDDDDGRGIGGIAFGERATLTNRNTHRVEVVGGDGAELGLRLAAAGFLG
jgi:hypothetical protein